MSADCLSMSYAELDACVMPVISLEEAAVHPHNVLANSFSRIIHYDQHMYVSRHRAAFKTDTGIASEST